MAEEPKTISDTKINATKVAFLTTIVALITPAAIDPYPSSLGNIAIISMTWILSFSGDTYAGPILILNPFGVVSLAQFTFLRIIFVLMVYLLYSGKTSLRLCAIVGIISEIQFPLVALLTNMPIIPIPILILVVYLLTRIFPPPTNNDDHNFIL